MQRDELRSPLRPRELGHEGRELRLLFERRLLDEVPDVADLLVEARQPWSEAARFEERSLVAHDRSMRAGSGRRLA